MWDTLPLPGRVVPIRLSRGEVWRALQQHIGCQQLRRADLPVQRLIGFYCNCSGREEMWQLPLTELRRMGPEWCRVFDALNHAEENWEWRRGLLDDWNLHDCERPARRAYGMQELAQGWLPPAINLRGLERLELEGLKHEEKVEKERRVARRKAGMLLHRHVDDSQWNQFRRKKHIHVTGSDGRLYRISKTIGQSVTLVVDGKDVARYCLVPRGHSWIPEADMMLAIKLMLETDATAFIKKANFFELNSAPIRVEQDGRPAYLRIDGNGQLVEVPPAIAEVIPEEVEVLEVVDVPQEPVRRRLRRAG